jgi:short-subunit dehydrogenase
MQIKNKRIVVTGVASGIGKALLNQVSRLNCTVLAVDRNDVALTTVVSSLQNSAAKIESYVCDIADQRNLDQLFAHADVVMGGIDIFIANAGYAYYEQLSQEDWEHIDQIFQVNVHSPIYTAIKMKNTHPASSYKVVITASAIGKLGLPGYALYAATKSAVDRFAEAYRFELDDPTQLALVYPIATRTNFFREASDHKAPTPWPSQTADQVASAIIKGIERDKKSIYPSFVYRMFLTVGKLIPVLFHLEQWIEKQRFEKWIEEKKKSI